MAGIEDDTTRLVACRDRLEDCQAEQRRLEDAVLLLWENMAVTDRLRLPHAVVEYVAAVMSFASQGSTRRNAWSE